MFLHLSSCPELVRPTECLDSRSDLVLEDREVGRYALCGFLFYFFNCYDEMTGERSELAWRVDFFFASRS